jgi:hypothetical protein
LLVFAHTSRYRTGVQLAAPLQLMLLTQMMGQIGGGLDRQFGNASFV